MQPETVHFGHPTLGTLARPTLIPHASPPSCWSEAEAFFTQAQHSPPPTALLHSRTWVECGCFSPSLLLRLPPPWYQARGGAGGAHPAPSVERAKRVLLPVILAGDFYLGAAGRREEETSGVVLSASDTLLGFYKLSTWDG